MSDFEWTDERVKEFARVYCGNPTDGFNAEAFHGLKMDEKINKFKEQVALGDDFKVLRTFAQGIIRACDNLRIVDADHYHAKADRLLSKMWVKAGLKGEEKPSKQNVSPTTQTLRDELKKRGYAVSYGCLWQSDDVRPHDPTGSLTEDERMDIMENVLNSEWLMEQINSMIEDEVLAYKNEMQ